MNHGGEFVADLFFDCVFGCSAMITQNATDKFHSYFGSMFPAK